jgi:endonuclease/exonuclease/phosphatase family metal-dependent hydrolase
MGPPPRRRHALHDQAWHYLLGLGPDLAFLQEAFPPAWARGQGTLVQGAITRWGSVIFSPRFPLERVRPPEDSNLRALGDYLAYGVTTLPDGSDVFVSSVHAVARPASKAQLGSLDSATVARSSVGVPFVNDVVCAGLEKLLAGRRFIIAGDWNTARLWDTVHGGTAGTEFFERAREWGWVECLAERNEEVQTWFRGTDHPYQLDHVFCAGPLHGQLQAVSVASEAATELELSDHAPLIVDFDVASISMTSLEPTTLIEGSPVEKSATPGPCRDSCCIGDARTTT